MSRPALFISDLHLPTQSSPTRDAFRRFLEGAAREASHLYILGDLFEYWIGDDIGLAEYAPEAQGLRDLTRSGVPVSFQHGNRDFLVGRRFSAATGVRLLADPVVADLPCGPALLSHGDRYCTDDVAYQRWRRFCRNPVVRGAFLVLPRGRRQRIADGMRRRSMHAVATKADSIMDVNPAAIAGAFRRHGVTRMIHGHTHRPADHIHDVDGTGCRRHVLADWHPGRAEALEVGAAGPRRVPLAA